MRQRARARNLRNSLPAICKAVTKQKGIKLVFQGPPRTDGKVIYSNPLPISADDDQIAVIVGDIDHECGHVLFTDFDVSKVIGRERNPQLVHLLTNAIEDTFIERRLGEKYPGCKATLSESVRILEEKGIDHQNMPLPRLLGMYIDAWGRKNVLRQPVEKSLVDAKKTLTPVLGEQGMKDLDALLEAEMAKVDSTQDSLVLAKKVLKLIEDIVDQQQQPEPDQSNESGESDESEGSGESEGSDESEGSGESEGSDESGESNAPGQSGGNGASNAPAAEILESQDFDTTPVFDRRDAKTEAIIAASAASPTIQSEGVVTTAGQNISVYDTHKREITGQVKRLQRNLVNEYQTRTRRRSVVAEEGRIDARRLTRAVMGDRRIFRETKHRTLPFPAVTVLLDMSGSMSGIAHLARQTMITVAETNAMLNVKTELIAFRGHEHAIMLKGFDEPFNNKVKGRIGGLYASGGTPTAEALWVAGNRLMAQKEERRLLLLVTDGKPNDHEAALRVAGMIERSPIELYGLSIVGDYTKTFITHSSVIMRSEDIADAVLSAIRQRILRAA